MKDKSLIHIIPVIWKRKKVIVGAVFAAGILTSVVMLLKPNFYRSTTTFYPVSSALLEPSLQINDRPVYYYGNDSDADRLLSMAQSLDLITHIIDTFDLATHYDIDPAHDKGMIKLQKTFRKRYKIQKTEYDAIELSVEDRDPMMSRRLTEAVMYQMDKNAIEIIQSSRRIILNNLNATYAANKLKLAIVTDSLQLARERYGIYNTKTQAEALTTLEIKSPGSLGVRSRVADYRAGISLVTNLESIQQKLNQGIANDALQIQQIEASLASQPSAIHVIEKASVPLEKSRPKRSLYVLAVMFLTGCLALVLVLIQAQLKTLSFD